MKTALALIAIVVAAASMDGCVSVPPAPPAQDFACIEGGVANFFSWLTEGEMFVSATPEAKAIQQGGRFRKCMPAGKNVLVVSGEHNLLVGCRERVAVFLGSRRQYQIRANMDSGSCRFLIVDVTEVPEKVAYDFKVEYGRQYPADQLIDLTAGAPPR